MHSLRLCRCFHMRVFLANKNRWELEMCPGVGLLGQLRHFDRNANSCTKLRQTQKIVRNCVTLRQNGCSMCAPAVVANSERIVLQKNECRRSQPAHCAMAAPVQFLVIFALVTLDFFWHFRQEAGARVATPGCCRCCWNSQQGSFI